jgi:predicted  nucleic acid-binding Zn-ribbon protein
MKMFNAYEKIKDKYKDIPPIETINNIDIVGVAKHDFEWMFEEIDSLHEWVETQEDAIKHLRFQLKHATDNNLENVLIKTHQKATERITELEKQINLLQQENEELKQNTPKSTTNPFTRTMCDCIDWRDLQASPFCPKCGGRGSY